MNDFDRVIYEACRKPSAMPELYRALIENEVLALVPFDSKTEAIGGMELENGDPFPFVQLTDEKGVVVVPIFSSEQRVEEALERAKVPLETYSIATVEGQAMMEILSAMGLHAVINKNCGSTGEITIPPDLIRDLASGKVFEPVPMAERETVRMRKIDPADFPTDLVQPLFEVLRKHANFRAAWIFTIPGREPLPNGGQHYAVSVLMEPRDEAIFHEFNMVVAAAHGVHDVGIGLVDEGDWSYVRGLFRRATPFFVAAGYEPPVAPGE